MMAPEDIARMFTGPGGYYAFARWHRPIAPVVFGVEEATLAAVKGAIETTTGIADHPMAETDPEQGANLMIFFLREWSELAGVPGMDDLVPGIVALAGKLGRQEADQYLHFRFEASGAIRACFVFVRMGGRLADVPVDALAVSVAVRAMLRWSQAAFDVVRPCAMAEVGAVVHPAIAALIRAAYDPAMPAVASDPSHALRLAARVRQG